MNKIIIFTLTISISDDKTDFKWELLVIKAIMIKG